MIDRREFFETVYRENQWSSPDSRSGPGSELSATENLRRELPALLQRFAITSVLDAPCGDFNWMQHLDLGGIQYVGGDIVSGIVQRNESQFGSSGRRFVQLDLASDMLPATDLIFCRDCLIHCSNGLVIQILRNIVQSRAKFLCTTHDVSYLRYARQDFQVGDLGYEISHRFRCINFTLPPFNFPPPIHVINEPDFWEDCKTMALWSIDDLRPLVLNMDVPR